MNAPVESVRFYSSWRGLIVAFFSPLLLLGLGATVLVAGGGPIVPFVLIVIGGGLAFVTVFDFPIHSTLTADGITRRAPLRAQALQWDRVDRLARARGGRFGRKPGPLAAVCGRRHYLLVDRCEGRDEFESLRRFLSREGIDCGLPGEPADDTVPTWLYHRPR